MNAPTSRAPQPGFREVIEHYTRIDPRSLGVFRVLMGLALILDWGQRWRNRLEFYSNDGLLPNHAHLYHLKNQGRFVWSGLHSVTTPGEAAVALLVILLFYLFFTVGYKTRAFQLASIVGMVSLSARNTLAEGPGDALAISLLVITLFLPLGTSHSIDALLGRIRGIRENKPRQLLDRAGLPTEEDIQRGRLPGFSPISIAAFGVMAFLSVVLLALWKQQTGASWKDGSALHKALNVFMVPSVLGWNLRNSGFLGALTTLVHNAQWLVPVLLLIPVLRGVFRSAAAILLLVYGLTYALLTTRYTLFGWCFVALSALVVSADTWRRHLTRHDPKKVRTVIFDVDCGICFWLAKTVRRWDTRRHLLFMGNGEFPPAGLVQPGEPYEAPPLLVWDETAQQIVDKTMPKGITPSLVEQTVVVVRPDGTFATRSAAVAQVLGALPGLSIVGLFLRIPGLSRVFDLAYDLVASRRQWISIQCGLDACGVLVHKKPIPLKNEVSPAARLRFLALAGLRESLGCVVVAALLIQTTQSNEIGVKVQARTLEPIAWWTRATEHWDILTPEPPSVEQALLVDAQLKDGRNIDLMTGVTATVSLDRPSRLTAQWPNYLEQVTKDEHKSLQEHLRKYFSRRGPKFTPAETGFIPGADGFWLTQPAEGAGDISVVRLFRHARGGPELNRIVAPFIVSAGSRPEPKGTLNPRSRQPEPEPEPEQHEEEERKDLPLRSPEAPPDSPGQE